MIPIISIVGKSEVGKTTLLEKLIPELKKRGYRIGVIKHDAHGFEIDKPGKDSWRLAQAGSDSVVISSSRKLALVKQVERERTPDELLAYLSEVDIVLTEGYKRGHKPKIEVFRRSLGGELLCSEEELLALVTDQPFDLQVPQFNLEDVVGLADLIEERYLAGPQERGVAVIADGQEIPLRTPFARQVVAEVVRGLLSTLQGTEGARRLVIILEDGG